MGAQATTEAVDRADLSFNNEVFEYLPHIEHPGKIIAGLSFSGPADIRNFTEHADAILYNVPPGQRYSEGWLSILFGKVNPSGKLAFTIPHNFKNLTFLKHNGQDLLVITHPTSRSITLDTDGMISTTRHPPLNSALECHTPNSNTST